MNIMITYLRFSHSEEDLCYSFSILELETDFFSLLFNTDASELC